MSTAPSFEQLKTFFEQNKLSLEAADSLKEGRTIALIVDGHSYTFTKKSGTNVLRDEAPQSPDFTFQIPGPVAQDLVTKPFHSVGAVGLFLFEEIITHDQTRKIHVKLHSGFLSLMTGGYFGILTAGGVDVAKFLASRGLGSLGKLKEVIGRMKN